MILFHPEHMKCLEDATKHAYPYESCGLIAGHWSNTEKGKIVTQVVTSPNVSNRNHRDSFEIDPQVRFNLMRSLEGSIDTIIGHYHSHPDHSAEPSKTDLEMAYEPDLTWVIIALDQLHTIEIRAFNVLPDASAFVPVGIQISNS